jgi:hypothetical protein
VAVLEISSISDSGRGAMHCSHASYTASPSETHKCQFSSTGVNHSCRFTGEIYP